MRWPAVGGGRELGKGSRRSRRVMIEDGGRPTRPEASREDGRE
ncbi:hypothetical protein [Candidatus Solincola sp.]|jgi:hypothetical protein|nr:hypothetical protein [Actinomycetota bacterium]MDI7251678.1 hypothetical protein [Actinomycetota bacterium]